MSTLPLFTIILPTPWHPDHPLPVPQAYNYPVATQFRGSNAFCGCRWSALRLAVVGTAASQVATNFLVHKFYGFESRHMFKTYICPLNNANIVPRMQVEGLIYIIQRVTGVAVIG